jgi:hypothetical protein
VVDAIRPLTAAELLDSVADERPELPELPQLPEEVPTVRRVAT